MNACTINVGTINAVLLQATHYFHCLNVKAEKIAFNIILYTIWKMFCEKQKNYSLQPILNEEEIGVDITWMDE